MRNTVLIKLLIFISLVASCERLENSFIIEGKMILNNKDFKLSRGSVQYSDVIKTLANGSKQHRFSFYRLNVSPNSDDEDKVTFIMTAFDLSRSGKLKFLKDDIEIKLIKSLENQTPNYKIYNKIIDAEFEIKSISKKDMIDGIFYFKIVSDNISTMKPDTMTVENGLFKAKIERFETSDF